jgi:hypothetical protein
LVIFYDNWITEDINTIANETDEVFKVLEHKYIIDEIEVDDLAKMTIPKGHNKTPIIPKKTIEVKRTGLKLDKTPKINELFYTIYTKIT